MKGPILEVAKVKAHNYVNAHDGFERHRSFAGRSLRQKDALATFVFASRAIKSLAATAFCGANFVVAAIRSPEVKEAFPDKYPSSDNMLGYIDLARSIDSAAVEQPAA